MSLYKVFTTNLKSFFKQNGKKMYNFHRLLGASAFACISLFSTFALSAPVKNIVLVHGILMDGSGWRAVYDILVRNGYDVSIVQQPLTGMDADIAATRRIVDQQDGPVILVGHSYGGVLVTEAGNDPKVKALVYVAALQPDVGETMGSLNAMMPAQVPESGMIASKDGYMILERSVFMQNIVAGLSKSDAEFLAALQVPTSFSTFTRKIESAAWHYKKSYAMVASDDRAISPALERWMYKRSGAEVTEIKATHAVFMSHPQEVAALIDHAARSSK